MFPTAVSDEALLAGSDPAGFEEFYGRHVDTLLGFFARRTRDAELAADLTAETFAAALSARRRYNAAQGSAIAWLFGIAMNKLADAQRRGYADKKARRRLGMERIDLTDADIAAEIEVSEAVVRKRVSRGLATVRQRMGARR
jgi:RNA polymerase sigma-70 factor (ECF subfamily)